MKPRRRDLARTLLTVGATAYGGPAIVARLREVVVHEQRWITEDEFQDTLAFCQLLPGPVAVQTAAHVGWRLHGGPGAAIALVSYMLPSFLLMLGLSAAYFRYGELSVVAAAFRGLSAAVVAIVAHSLLSLTQSTVRDVRGLLITAAAAVGFFAGFDTLLVLAVAAAAGLLLFTGRGVTGQHAANGEVTPRTTRRYRRTVARVLAVAAVAAVLALASGLLSPSFPPLAAAMTRINLLAFGGGYTAVALMFREVVGNGAHGWLTAQEFIDGLAMGQITPGPVIITGTFIGYKVGGVPGALVATLFVFLPSALVLVLLAPHFARVRDLAVVQSAVRGLLAAFVGMLLFVLAKVAASALIDLRTLPLAVAAFAALRLRVPMLVVILAALLAALLLLR